MSDDIVKIRNYPDLVKVDSSYIINTNEQEYQAAKARNKNTKKMLSLEQRLSSLENSVNQILIILQGLSNVSTTNTPN